MYKQLYILFLSIVLSSVGLQAQTITGTVTEEGSNEPLIGATVMIEGTTTGTTTDLDGKFSLEVPKGAVLLVRFIGYNDQRITVGDSRTYTIKLVSGVEMQEIVIVGSRGKPRTRLETAVPIDVIGEKQLETTPQTELGQVLQYAAPSFHSTKQNIGHGSDHIDPMALRGLGADQTLVLVNGKRRHASSLMNVNGTVGRGQVGTDMNSIPMAAIKRVEVLRDGAAAQYGSDAIAGVINLVLKNDVNKGSITLHTGGLSAPPTAPDFLQTAEFNPYSDIDGLQNNTQNAGGGESLQLSANYGLGIGEKGGFANFTFNYLTKEPFNRMDDFTIEMFAADDPRRGDQIAEYAAFNQGDPAAIAAYNDSWGDQFGYATVNELNDFEGRRMANMGGSGTTNAGFFLNSEVPLNDSSVFYAFGGFNYRLGRATGFVRRPNQEARQSGLYPLGFAPHLDSDISDASAAVGFRSKLKGWDIDLSNSFGGNSFAWTIFNSNNASQGLESGTSFDAGKLRYKQNVLNMDVSKGYDIGFPINLAFGSEFRLENFQQVAGQDESWQNYGDTTSTGALRESGSQVFPGYQRGNEVDKFRFNTGVYADIEAEFSEKWLMGLAGRLEDYSDFGNNFSWKVSSRYKILDNVALRGAYSTGFRAPSLPQKYFSAYTLQFISVSPGVIDGVNIAHLNDDSYVTRQFGIENLRPETSTNISIGATARLFKKLSLTVDAYQIDIKDRIGITGRFSGAMDPRFDQILTSSGLTQVQFMTNAVDTETKGLDVVMSYVRPTENGSLTINLGGNFTKTRIPRDANGDPIIKTGDFLEGFETELFNREEISRLEVAQPQSKVILGAIYSFKRITGSITATRFGEIEYVHPSDDEVANAWNDGVLENRDQIFSGKTLIDLDISYKLSEGIKLGIGGTNIFNIYPDRHTHSGNYSGGMFPYSRRVSQFGLAGAGYYVSARFNF